MGISREELQNIALTITNIKKTEDDDLEECDTMLLFGHVLGYNGVK